MTTILVIEDESDIHNLLKLQLTTEGHKVLSAYNFKEAIGLLNQNNSIDLALIDRMLPDGKGVDICKTIRQSEKYKKIPIIFVTAMSMPENVIEGLDAGADDYITKPFDNSILAARVRALLRRADGSKVITEDFYQFNDLLISPKRREVKIGNEEITLTQSEFDILLSLAKEDGIVLTRQALINQVFGEGVHVTSRTIDTHMVSLRKKLGNKSRFIETIRGVGYRFYAEEES